MRRELNFIYLFIFCSGAAQRESCIIPKHSELCSYYRTPVCEAPVWCEMWDCVHFFIVLGHKLVLQSVKFLIGRRWRPYTPLRAWVTSGRWAACVAGCEVCVCVFSQCHVTAAVWGRCEQKKVAGGGGLFQSWLLKEMECHSVGSMNVKSEGSKDGGVWCSSDHGGHDRSGKRRFCGNMGGFMYYLIMQRME